MKIDFGNKIDDINVKISYRIIELFSAGLYSSANKAFEELICNSYDAMAKNVSVFISENNSDRYIWIFDDGNGMNGEELKQLWNIGNSNKREKEKELNRKQIGKFGIGKLSTYILANKLTYISKKEDKYFLTTMDYSKISNDVEDLSIDAKEATFEEINNFFKSLEINNDKLNFNPFDTKINSWTMAILSDLKDKSRELQLGRLKWILESALPLSGEFKLMLNGQKIESSKINKKILKKWVIGKDDIDLINKYSNLFKSGSEGDKTYISTSNIEKIFGEFSLYEDSLLEGKSNRVGRSNGVFLYVRNRLVNFDDPLLGIPPISHGVLNRINVKIYVDDLDDSLTSTRESIKENEKLQDLKSYLTKMFNIIKEYHYNNEKNDSNFETYSERISQSANIYAKSSIISYLEKIKVHDVKYFYMIEHPTTDIDELIHFFKDINGKNTNEIIDNLEFSFLNPSDPIAKYIFDDKKIIINGTHPLVSNFYHEKGLREIINYLAFLEFINEIMLVDSGLQAEKVVEILKSRDEIFRALVNQNSKGIFATVNLLSQAKSSPDGLENACLEAFRSLGFNAEKIGGNNEPDGLVEAILDAKNSKDNYKFTFDAKSTKKEKIKANTAHISGVKRHQEKYEANYSIIIAPGYEGQDVENSAISIESRESKVSIFRVDSLIKLLIFAIPKQFNFYDFRDCLDTCYSPKDVDSWIDNFVNSKQNPDIKGIEVLNVIDDLQKNDDERPTLSVIRRVYNEKYNKQYSIDDISRIVSNLNKMAPKYVRLDIDSKTCLLNQSVDIIIEYLNESVKESIPFSYREMYFKNFK